MNKRSFHYISGSELPSRSAGSLHVMKICAALAKRGHKVTLFTISRYTPDKIFDSYEMAKSFEIRVVRPSKFRFAGGFWFALATSISQLRSDRADICYGRHAHAVWASSFFCKGVAYEAHELAKSHWKTRFETALFARNNFKSLVCITHVLANDYASRHAGVTTHVVPDAADPPKPPEHSLANWPGREERTQVGYVGHLYPGKGMEVIEQIAPLLPEMDFHIVGGMPADINRWKNRVESLNVHFHGFKKHAALADYYAKFQIVLLPNQETVASAGGGRNIGRWTSPLKAFEYMSYGIPIVASNLKVLREIFRHEQNALLADPNDPAAWCTAIRRLALDSQLANHLASRAFKEFEVSYTWDARAHRIEQLFNEHT